MGYINSEKPPEKWSAAFFKAFVERIRTGINYLTEENFPSGVSGSIINSRTLKLSALAGFSIEKVLFAQVSPVAITDTGGLQVGGFVQWTPSEWSSGVSVRLEVVGGVSNALATATFELWGLGASPIATITTQATVLTLLRSAVFSPPSDGQTLYLKVKTSNASYSAQAVSARLIITPSS